MQLFKLAQNKSNTCICCKCSTFYHILIHTMVLASKIQVVIADLVGLVGLAVLILVKVVHPFFLDDTYDS